MKINELKQETVELWNNLKNVGTSQPKFLPEDLIYFGVRDTEDAENHLIESKGIKNYTVSEIRLLGVE